ncbi:MAG TPA: zinc-ribbon domain-containing protein [Kofleriaceae bacterium]|nr:zinc-ribbon domain-containing protein [Kofleriaceae bacterium]
MRCPSCGTENAPDSRFCGGCGARLGASGPRVAPTAKISDDAPYPSAYGQAAPAVPASIPPAAMPAAASRPSSVPPAERAAAGSLVAPLRPSPAELSSPSMSMAPPPRRSGLVAIVLVIDLALAATGAVLLAKGLAARGAQPQPPPPPAPAPASHAAIDPPTPAAEPIAPEPEPAARPVVRADAGAPHQRAPAKPARTVAPRDPYAPDLANEVELTTTRAAPSFRRCYDAAAAGADLHGKIEIAFQVLPDGLVARAAAITNTTGSPALASCLVATITAWSFAVHPARPTSFVRPFDY